MVYVWPGTVLVSGDGRFLLVLTATPSEVLGDCKAIQVAAVAAPGEEFDGLSRSASQTVQQFETS